MGMFDQFLQKIKSHSQILSYRIDSSLINKRWPHLYAAGWISSLLLFPSHINMHYFLYMMYILGKAVPAIWTGRPEFHKTWIVAWRIEEEEEEEERSVLSVVLGHTWYCLFVLISADKWYAYNGMVPLPWYH